MIVSPDTARAVAEAADALRRVKGRSPGPERRALVQALNAAEVDLSTAVSREYPGLLQWRLPAPGSYRWDSRADRGAGGWRAWRSSSQLARAALRWLDEAPAYAAQRVAQAYGVGASLGLDHFGGLR